MLESDQGQISVYRPVQECRKRLGAECTFGTCLQYPQCCLLVSLSPVCLQFHCTYMLFQHCVAIYLLGDVFLVYTHQAPLQQVYVFFIYSVFSCTFKYFFPPIFSGSQCNIFLNYFYYPFLNQISIKSNKLSIYILSIFLVLSSEFSFHFHFVMKSKRPCFL